MDSGIDPDSPTAPGSDPPIHPVVALGGTFDHLHAGHKILLSMAAWIADEKVIIGVTGSVISDAVELLTKPTCRRHAAHEKG
jgi:cytidyltransferase-like protein